MDKRVAYVNGTVYTMESLGDTCTAFVVEDGKFAYCGTDQAAVEGADEVIDLQGATVLPGMIDTHQHVFASARNLIKLDLADVTSLKGLQDKLYNYAKDLPAGQWVLGFGFDQEKFDPPVLPTRYDLDAVCPNNPVLLTRYCLHINVANSPALDAGGIRKGFVPKVAGTVGFFEDGEPNGMLSDAAASDVIAIMPDMFATQQAKKDAVERACHELNRRGLVGVHPIQGLHCDLPEYTSVYQDLSDEGRLTVRVYLGYDELPNCNIRTGLGDDMVKYGFYKLYGDGNMGGRTAYLSEPYADDPGQCGVTNYTQEQLNARVRAAYERNIQVGMHVIGDRAAEMLVNAIEAVYCANPKPNARFRMIHASLLSEALISRMKQLPIIVDMQPMFISTNVKWAESRVGPQRGKYLFCWRRLLDEGIILTAGSDAPCESYDPIDGIFALVNRQNREGYPAQGWHSEQRITVYEALSMYTRNAAYASCEEDIKGTIRQGKLADFVTLNKDLFKIDPKNLHDVYVTKTYLGGKEVYSCD